MKLGEFYTELDRYGLYQETAFGHLHSYRGYYDQAAIDPTFGSTVSYVLDEIEDAMAGKVFTGWKGGDFIFTENTPLWASYEGETSSLGITGITTNGWGKLVLTTFDVSDYQGF